MARGSSCITGRWRMYAGPAVFGPSMVWWCRVRVRGPVLRRDGERLAVAGQAYTYSYATMASSRHGSSGGICARICRRRRDGGSGCRALRVMLGLFGVHIPASLTAPPTQLCTASRWRRTSGGMRPHGIEPYRRDHQPSSRRHRRVMPPCWCDRVSGSRSGFNSLIADPRSRSWWWWFFFLDAHPVCRTSTAPKWTPFIHRKHGGVGSLRLVRGGYGVRAWCSSPNIGFDAVATAGGIEEIPNATCPSHPRLASRI